MSEKIEAALKNFTNKRSVNWFMTGSVTAVNATKKTCTVAPADGGAEYFGIRLRPVVNSADTGLWVKPKIGSPCVVGFLDEKQRSGYLVSCEQFEGFTIKSANGAKILGKSNGKLELNGNSYSLLKDTDTKVELAKMKARLDAVIACLNTGANVGGPVIFSGIGAVTALPSEDFSSIENQNVKHG